MALRAAATARCRATRADAADVERAIRYREESFRELVAHAVHSEDVPRPSGIRLNLPSNVLDVRVYRPVERLGVVAADGIEQLRSRQNPSRFSRERRHE